MAKIDVVMLALLRSRVKKIIKEEGLAGGKTAYDVAVDNGFEGTQEEWLKSLRGATPYIGDNGNWFIEGVDTGKLASTAGAMKITSKSGATELIIDETNGTISSAAEDGTSTVVANYTKTDSIDSSDIDDLFN